MELENIILSDVSIFRRPKATCSLSYVKYRSKTNAVILWDTGHTKGRSFTGGIGQKETKNSNVVDLLSTGVNTEILNCLETPWVWD
jgi:hypothetical protein